MFVPIVLQCKVVCLGFLVCIRFLTLKGLL